MTLDEVMKELESKGNESHRRIFANHGATGSCFGVKIEDLKKIQKKIKGDQALAMALYDTGNSDAMYLAGLVADGAKMTKKDLKRWVEKAPWQMISEYTVPWVTTEHPDGLEIALEWIDSKKEKIASSGWSTLSGLVSIVPDDELDDGVFRRLLERVEKTIHDQPNRVRYTMNGFVIAVGGGMTSLSKAAAKTAKAIGKVSVDMGGTACKVPFAPEYIAKIESMGRIGKKRKTIRC